MSNLFIIGNGFDLDHGLSTSYENFRKYLITKYPNALNIKSSFNIKSTAMRYGRKTYNLEKVVAFLIAVIYFS
ncbi:AbiH family protein [Priestia aryabhattai]|uniref:AbiH family protein n=1 Tax=Priestia aryabhattai TaxID=412384 RepID=UPI001CBF660C|nr:AbiH family protein [Priestia aryabhattai]